MKKPYWVDSELIDWVEASFLKETQNTEDLVRQAKISIEEEVYRRSTLTNREILELVWNLEERFHFKLGTVITIDCKVIYADSIIEEFLEEVSALDCKKIISGAIIVYLSY